LSDNTFSHTTMRECVLFHQRC